MDSRIRGRLAHGRGSGAWRWQTADGGLELAVGESRGMTWDTTRERGGTRTDSRASKGNSGSRCIADRGIAGIIGLSLSVSRFDYIAYRSLLIQVYFGIRTLCYFLLPANESPARAAFLRADKANTTLRGYTIAPRRRFSIALP